MNIKDKLNYHQQYDKIKSSIFGTGFMKPIYICPKVAYFMCIDQKTEVPISTVSMITLYCKFYIYKNYGLYDHNNNFIELTPAVQELFAEELSEYNLGSYIRREQLSQICNRAQYKFGPTEDVSLHYENIDLNEDLYNIFQITCDALVFGNTEIHQKLSTRENFRLNCFPKMWKERKFNVEKSSHVNNIVKIKSIITKEITTFEFVRIRTIKEVIINDRIEIIFPKLFECCVCFSETSALNFVELKPCKHKLTCLDCTNNLLNSHKANCPLCRAIFQTYRTFTISEAIALDDL